MKSSINLTNQGGLRLPVLLMLFALTALLLAACNGASVDEPAAAEAQATAVESEEPPEGEDEAATEAVTDTNAAAEAVEMVALDSGDRPAAVMDPAERDGMYDAPPEMAIDPGEYYYATIQTDKGDIKLQLFADRAPQTVNNFVFLANQGYYDGTTFHRVLEGFMAQGGDPSGTGAGGPGYQFADEFAPGLSFDRPGLLAMANAGPGTNGSQFFITFAPTGHLDNRHTIFGEVIEGSEVLGELTRRDPGQAPDFAGDTIEAIIIEEGGESLLPTPTPLPPTPTPYPPSSMEGERPLAALEPSARANYFNAPPEMVIDSAKSYAATIKTSQGDMMVELFADKAPIAVNNFVVLADLGFYDGTSVFQVVPEQVVIIGSPDNSPTGDAGYVIDAETGLDVIPAVGSISYIPFQDAPGGPIQHSSSQLLIALIDPPVEANAEFSFFGQVIDGIDVLETLTDADTIDEIIIVAE